MIAHQHTGRIAIVFAVVALVLIPLTAFAQVNGTTPTGGNGNPPAAAPAPASVAAAFASLGSSIKIDGRLFAGVFVSGDDGKYLNRTLAIPDAKLRFSFTPNKTVTGVARFSANNTTVSSLDYLYLDLNDWGGILPGHLIRIGRHLVDFGEEAWLGSPEDSILITNSASSVITADSGLNFRGSVPVTSKHPLLYSVEVLNGTGNTTASQHPLTVIGKLGGSPLPHLYLSVSALSTGNITGATSIPVAALTAAPTGATTWSRKITEVDVRYNYGPTGTRSVIGADPVAKYQIGAAYGTFNDDVEGAGTDREGSYWYVEGLVNVTSKLYAASRFSNVSLKDGYLDKLVDSPVAVNKYTRTSIGLGYRLSPLVHLKSEYTINDASGGATDPSLNQFAVGLATKF